MTLAPPPRSTLRPITPAGPKRFTVEEFHALGEAGMLEGKGSSLIRGVIHEEGPMNPPHAIAVELCTRLFVMTLGLEWRVRIQVPLPLGKASDPMPDVAVMRGTPRDSNSHPTTADLVVEISDTSFKFDTNEKLILYASAGITDYWVLDLNDRLLYVFRDPQRDGTYGEQLTLKESESVAPLAVPDKPIRVADLLP
jgi:Uma2 family endonuclease